MHYPYKDVGGLLFDSGPFLFHLFYVSTIRAQKHLDSIHGTLSHIDERFVMRMRARTALLKHQ
jgi:hypothetical protein